MGLAKRIIPCLDVKDGETVKGVNFENLRNAVDPVELVLMLSRMSNDCCMQEPTRSGAILQLYATRN